MPVKQNKGILFRIPLFLMVCGFVIILVASWNLIKQIYMIKGKVLDPKQITLDEKEYKINNMMVKRPGLGSKFGQIIIPSVSIDYPLIHGDRDEDLENGVGHFAGSTLPGEGGNVVLAGHRDTVFRNLKNIKLGDEIELQTYYGLFYYKVSNIRIVEPNDKTVVVTSSREMLTLYTCYPFEYIGHAPKRYAVNADFIKSEEIKGLPKNE